MLIVGVCVGGLLGGILMGWWLAILTESPK